MTTPKKPAQTPASEPAKMIGDVYPPNIPTDAAGNVATVADMTPEEIRAIGALDAESARANHQAQKKAAALASGNSQAVQWGGVDGDQKYDTTIRVLGRGGVNVTLKRVGPPDREHDYGVLPPHEVDSYDRMTAFFKEHLWDGDVGVFEWKIKRDGQQKATDKFRLSRDPLAMANYARKAELARSPAAAVAQPAGVVGAPPPYAGIPAGYAPAPVVAAPVAPTGPSQAHLEWYERRLADLESRLAQAQQPSPAPATPPQAAPPPPPVVSAPPPASPLQAAPVHTLPTGERAYLVDGVWLVPYSHKPEPQAPPAPPPPPQPAYVPQPPIPQGFTAIPATHGPPAVPPQVEETIPGMPPGGEPGFVLDGVFMQANVGPRSQLPARAVLAFRYKGRVFWDQSAQPAAPAAPTPQPQAAQQQPIPVPGQGQGQAEDLLAPLRNIGKVMQQVKKVSEEVQGVGALFGLQPVPAAGETAAAAPAPNPDDVPSATNHPYMDAGPVRMWRGEDGNPKLDMDISALLLNGDKIVGWWEQINASNVNRAREAVDLERQRLQNERMALELEERKRALASGGQNRQLPPSQVEVGQGPTVATEASLPLFDPSDLHGPPSSAADSGETPTE